MAPLIFTDADKAIIVEEYNNAKLALLVNHQSQINYIVDDIMSILTENADKFKSITTTQLIAGTGTGIKLSNISKKFPVTRKTPGNSYGPEATNWIPGYDPKYFPIKTYVAKEIEEILKKKTGCKKITIKSYRTVFRGAQYAPRCNLETVSVVVCLI
jgi:hypothetical protein